MSSEFFERDCSECGEKFQLPRRDLPGLMAKADQNDYLSLCRLTLCDYHYYKEVKFEANHRRIMSGAGQSGPTDAQIRAWQLEGEYWANHEPPFQSPPYQGPGEDR